MLDSGDNGERLQQASTAVVGTHPASYANLRELSVTVHDRTCLSPRSDVQQRNTRLN